MVGRIEKVNLRDVWKKEAKDFTDWLFDNIEVLGEELDIDLTTIEKEKKVGSFSADIIAEDETGQKVLIENQLEKTDHDHLGKILTYVSNLDAKTAIWISSKPHPEHERAIDWLNESASGAKFYLVKVEAYKIGNSEPAAKFTIIAGPSERTEAVAEDKEELAARHKKRLEFWKILLEKAKGKTPLHSNISTTIYHWIGAGSGRSGMTYNYVITYKYGSVELYIDRGKNSGIESKQIFDELYSHKKEIEEIFGAKLEWERLNDSRASRITKRYNYAGLNDKDKWDKLQDDMITGMMCLEKALKKYLNNLKL
ncbi:MAG: DUF4268 domain-containing protein [Candidatus Omnitrophica bacterium]|nr:DUF4268 domain-containing protein [Candidatus Omnitrophota bacterium]